MPPPPPVGGAPSSLSDIQAEQLDEKEQKRRAEHAHAMQQWQWQEQQRQQWLWQQQQQHHANMMAKQQAEFEAYSYPSVNKAPAPPTASTTRAMKPKVKSTGGLLMPLSARISIAKKSTRKTSDADGAAS